MNQPSSQFVKKTILKLLRAIGSEKEIKKYIQRFSSAEQHLAVIKVGGSVVKDDLENLITSLIFLDQVGLKPVILHGAGPMLTEELESRAIDFSFIDGQRVTSNEVMNVAKKVFTETNKRIVEKLIIRGANVNHQNAQGNTALHFALAFDTQGMIGEFLIEHGADDTIENLHLS